MSRAEPLLYFWPADETITGDEKLIIETLQRTYADPENISGDGAWYIDSGSKQALQHLLDYGDTIQFNLNGKHQIYESSPEQTDE